MTIFVQDPNVKIWTILVLPNDSIELLKGKLVLVAGIPIDQQQLIFAGK
jgi:hypothetical protein